MKLISCTEESTNRRKLEIEVDADTFKAAYNKVFAKQTAKLTVPGFRKGKAPKALIEKMYGKEAFYEDAVNEVYPEALDWAIKEAELEYVDDQIELDVSKVDEEGLVFSAVITVKPEVKIEGYKGLKAERPCAHVSDEDVMKDIDAVRDRNARTVVVSDRALENGDIAEFDFEGFVDDTPFEGGKAENYTLTIGSGQFIPGFEDQMVGHNAGEEFDVNVTFPEEYHAEELKGKQAVFKIKLHEIKTRELPELDDDFVKDISEFDTVDEYKADVRAQLEKKAAEKAEDAVGENLTDQLIGLIEAEIPEAMINNRIEDNIRDFAYRLQSQGLKLEDYLMYTGGSIDALRESMKDQSERQVKLRLGLEQIVKLEGIEVSDEELDAEFAKLAEQYQMDVEAIKNAIPADGLKGDLAVENAIKLVRENAEISDCE
ncbi:MAG: trigger factor [Clostridia bacterium]|nr:trigger factor [Clostridia bacterium]